MRATDEWVEDAATKLPTNVREALKAYNAAYAAFEDALMPFNATKRDVTKNARPTNSLSDAIETVELLSAEEVKTRYLADLKAYRAYYATFERRDASAKAFYVARENAAKALLAFFLGDVPTED